MEPGTTMLYAVLIDPQNLDPDAMGVAYVVLHRQDETVWDVTVQTPDNTVLFAARGSLEKLNQDFGQGRLLPVGDQAAVRAQYGAKWPIGPDAFFMFRAAGVAQGGG